MGVKGGLNHNERQDIARTKRRHYHLQKNLQYMNIKQKYVGVNNIIENNGFIFHYNIRSDHILCIGYVDIIRIPCSYSVCFSKLSSTWNIR